MKNLFKKQGGFLIIEVLLAIVILTMVFLSIFSTLSFLTNRTEKSKFDTQAASIMQDGIEQTRTTLLAHWSQYNSGSYYPTYNNVTGSWTLMSGEEAVLEGRFKRQITISPVCRSSLTAGLQIDCPQGIVDTQSKLVKVRLSWAESEKEKEAMASLLIFKPK